MVNENEAPAPDAGTELGRERSWSDRAYWAKEIRKALSQENYVRAEVVKSISDKMLAIKKTFKNIVINEAKLTFIDMSAPEKYRKERPWNDLKSPRFKSFKALSDAEKARISTAVDVIFAKRKDAERNLDQDKVDDQTSSLTDALHTRQQKEDINDDVIAMMESITGYLPYNDKYHFRISVDPMDVYMKSTGQTWSSISCESVNGCCSQGSFSDISLYNAVAFLEDNSRKEIARIMIRWCEPAHAKRKYDIGIEASIYGGVDKKVYLTELSNRRNKLLPDVFGYDVYRSLYNQLNEKGFLDYEECKTPYHYEGYSDIMTDSGVSIRYHKLELPLKYSGETITKFDALMESNDSNKSREMIEDYRKPPERRELSENEILMLLNSMPRSIIITMLTESPQSLGYIIFTHYHFDVLTEVPASSPYMHFLVLSKNHADNFLAMLIYSGYSGEIIDFERYTADNRNNMTDNLVNILYKTKDMSWNINIENYAYIALTCLKWFINIKAILCPGRMETAVSCVALQVLIRTFDTKRILLDLKMINELIASNKVSLIGALLAYIDKVAQTSFSWDMSFKPIFIASFTSAATKYAELYVYSQRIIDEWFKQQHDITTECGACGIDEQSGEPKRFTISRIGKNGKPFGKTMNITLCSQCATKIFIVYCADEKKYARRLRMVDYYYARRNFAPESYCEHPEATKTYKKWRVSQSGQDRLREITSKYLARIGYVERYSITYMGKLKKSKA